MSIPIEGVDSWLRQELPPRLRKLRIDKGLTQNELAAMADLTRAVYGDIERGKWKSSPKLIPIIKIAVALGCAPEKLLPPLP